VVQVIATITLDSTTVTTKPVEITVNAGYPDQNHFSISPSQYVFADDQSTSGTATFTISAADKYSNPVKPGTAIYCNTQAGKITVPDGGTDANGFATATLFTFAPTPFTSSFCDESVADYVNGGTVGRVGYEWVYAHTVGENSETVKDSVCVLWSVAPIKIAFDGGTVSTAPTRPTITLVSHGSSISHTIRIVDSYGNPLPAFTKISVAVEYDESIYDGLKFSVGGDLSTTIPNAAYARFLQEGISDFVFEVSDNSKSDFTGSVTLVITVTSTIETLSISIPVTVTATP
jgi:hypothetical protein